MFNVELQKELQRFIETRVEIFLDNLTQKALKRQHLSAEREVTKLIQNIIQKIKETDLRQAQMPSELLFIESWKKDFSKNILIPKYLMKDQTIPLDEILMNMKRIILNAFIEKKVQLHIQLCKQHLISQLIQTEARGRLLKAKQVIQEEASQLQKEDKDFSKKTFLEAFNPEEIKTLIDQLPLKKREMNQEQQKLIDYLKFRLAPYLKDLLKNSLTLTNKLNTLNQLLIHYPTDLINTWIKEHAPLINALNSKTPFIEREIKEEILKEKAEILLDYCQKEIAEAKKKTTFEAFPKQREAILKKYHQSYLHESNENDRFVKQIFQERFQEDEKKIREKSVQERIIAEAPSQRPKKQRGWKV